jgi:hypothetical protein
LDIGSLLFLYDFEFDGFLC